MNNKTNKRVAVIATLLVLSVLLLASYRVYTSKPEPKDLEDFSAQWRVASITQRYDLLPWLLNAELERGVNYAPTSTRLADMSHPEVLGILGAPMDIWGEEDPHPSLLYDVSGFDKWSDPIGNFIVPFQDYMLIQFDDVGNIESIELIS